MTPDRKEQPLSNEVPRPHIGQPFNPCHRVCGFYPPDVVARQRDLTDGQKRLYERAVRWAGRNGRFWRSFETIAEALGKSIRQVKSDMAALEALGLITHARRGNRQTNIYRFLWHQMFESEVQPTALQKLNGAAGAKCNPASSEVQDSAKSEVQSTAHEFSPLLNYVQNSIRSQQRISDDESQKPPIRSSDVGLTSSGFTEESRKTTAAPATAGLTARVINPKNLPAKAEPKTRDQNQTRGLARISMIATAWMNEHPPLNFEENCLRRAYGHATADEIADYLMTFFTDGKVRRGYRFNDNCGPHDDGWNWFYTIIGVRFNPAEQGRSPEPVAAPHPSNRATRAEMDYGIEAIEVPA